MNQVEQWIKIAGFDKYSVSDKGNVRNDKTGRLLQATDNGRGYLRICLRKNKKSKTIKVHRLVASLFIPNPEKKMRRSH